MEIVHDRAAGMDISKRDGQTTLFELRRFRAFFTTSTLDTVTADWTHRAPAAMELGNEVTPEPGRIG